MIETASNHQFAANIETWKHAHIKHVGIFFSCNFYKLRVVTATIGNQTKMIACSRNRLLSSPQ